ncbi:hypothetical protein [Niveispirillum fermenti]|uniref:hypothetical protein n=1 Tax=Niveispirillum fermenti TaxID=1233113 RepID=UPI003A893D9D
MDIVIHTVAAATWTKYGKWRVELELANQPKRTCWLTAAQYEFLASAFKHTKRGYSDKRCVVIGEFSDEGRYIRCRAIHKPPQPKHTTPLVEEFDAAPDLLDHD